MGSLTCAVRLQGRKYFISEEILIMNIQSLLLVITISSFFHLSSSAILYHNNRQRSGSSGHVNFPMQLYAKPCYDGYCFVPGWFALLTATSFAKQTHTLEAAGQGGLGIAGAAGVAKPTGPSRTTDRSYQTDSPEPLTFLQERPKLRSSIFF